MFEVIGKGISKQFKEIISLHFSEEDEKSEERKKTEKKIKRVIDGFRKLLNLVVYFMLVIIIMRVAVILIINPEQGLYEAEKYKNGYEQYKTKPIADTLRKMDSIIRLKDGLLQRKEDSLDILKRQIARGDTAYIACFFNRDTTNDFPPFVPEKTQPGINTKGKSRYVTLPDVPGKPYGAVVKLNKGENYSIWKEDYPGTMKIVLMFGVLLFLLWIMKWIMKLFYKFVSLIAPFDIIKLIGMYFFVMWIWVTAHHLFDIATLFQVTDKITPHVFVF